MFQIRPAVPEDYYSVKECLSQHQKELVLTLEMGIMVADENGFAGLGMYRADSERAELLEVITVNEQDQELAFFIGKAVLNKLDLLGVEQVFCQNGSLEDLLKKLGFCQEGQGKWRLSLKGYFTTPCHKKQ